MKTRSAMMILQSVLLQKGLPVARMLLGVAAGKISLAFDPNPVNAIAIAAGLPILLGYVTSEWEQ
jgi:hypothetical protein